MTDFAAIYTSAALMNGISPGEVEAMSLGQWIALAGGWSRAHRQDVDPPSVEEFEAAVLAARSV